MIPSIRASVVTPTVLGVFLVMTLLLARRPYYNWDMFPYMAVAMDKPGVPFDSIHQRVYEAARESMLSRDFQAISIRQPELRDDAGKFEHILKYFVIKPGYTLLVTFFYATGVEPVLATCLPSLISYFCLGCLAYFWGRRLAPPIPSAMLALLIGLSPLVIDLARYSSPDLMCSLLCATGFFFIVRDMPYRGLTVLLAALWVRPDTVLLFVALTVGLALGGRIRWIEAGAFFVAGSLSLALVLRDFSVLREFVLFDEPLAYHLDAYRDSGPSLIHSLTLPALVVAVTVIFVQKAGEKTNLGSVIVMAVVASMLARYALHPFVEDRFNLPAYLAIVFITWDTVAIRYYRANP